LYASCVGRDECILSYLTELTVEENADVKSGYRIALAFDVNPLFHNSVIEKRLSWHEGGELTMQTTPMSWKPGQDPLALSGDSAVGGGEDKKRSFEQLTVEEGQVGELRRVGCCKRVGAQPCPDR